MNIKIIRFQEQFLLLIATIYRYQPNICLALHYIIYLYIIRIDTHVIKHKYKGPCLRLHQLAQQVLTLKHHEGMRIKLRLLVEVKAQHLLSQKAS